jgi:hypothetical protein
MRSTTKGQVNMLDGFATAEKTASVQASCHEKSSSTIKDVASDSLSHIDIDSGRIW